MDDELPKSERQATEPTILFQQFLRTNDESLNNVIDQHNAESTYYQCLYAWLKSIPENKDEEIQSKIIQETHQFIAYKNVISMTYQNRQNIQIDALDSILDPSTIAVRDNKDLQTLLPKIEEHFKNTYLNSIDRASIPYTDTHTIRPTKEEIENSYTLMRNFNHEIMNPLGTAAGFFSVAQDDFDTDAVTPDTQTYLDNGMSLLVSAKTLFERYGQAYSITCIDAVAKLNKQLRSLTIPTHRIEESNLVGLSLEDHINQRFLQEYSLQGSDALFFQLANNIVQNTNRMYEAMRALPQNDPDAKPRDALETISQDKSQETHTNIQKRLTVVLDTVDDTENHYLHVSFRDFGTGFPETLRQDDGTFRFKENVTGYVGGRKGNGIGMAALQDQIESLGGSMILTNVDDDEGTGALLEVFFKLSPIQPQS